MSTFDWMETHPTHVKVWLLYFYQCSIDSRHRENHSALTMMGHKRIQALIGLGVSSGDFACQDPAIAAKLIQSVISGAVITLLTETSSVSAQQIRMETLKICRICVGAR